MGAMGVLVSGDPDKCPKHIEPQQGEIESLQLQPPHNLQIGWIRIRPGSNADTLWWVFVRETLTCHRWVC